MSIGTYQVNRGGTISAGFAGLSFCCRKTSEQLSLHLAVSVTQCRGVEPSSCVTRSVWAPSSNSKPTILGWPAKHAKCSGVAPHTLSAASLLAPASTNNRTHSACPLAAAKWMARRPLMSLTSGSWGRCRCCSTSSSKSPAQADMKLTFCFTSPGGYWKNSVSTSPNHGTSPIHG